MSAVKVEWNILGTVLSTSGGEDGKVRVWKREFLYTPTDWMPWRGLGEHLPLAACI